MKVDELLTGTVNIFVFQSLPPQITVAFRSTYVLQKYQKLNLAMMTSCQSLDKGDGLMHRREDNYTFFPGPGSSSIIVILCSNSIVVSYVGQIKSNCLSSITRGVVAQSPALEAHVLCVRAFRVELEFRSAGFWGEGKTGVPGGKLKKKKGFEFWTLFYTWLVWQFTLSWLLFSSKGSFLFFFIPCTGFLSQRESTWFWFHSISYLSIFNAFT